MAMLTLTGSSNK